MNFSSTNGGDSPEMKRAFVACRVANCRVKAMDPDHPTYYGPMERDGVVIINDFGTQSVWTYREFVEQMDAEEKRFMLQLGVVV